MQEYDQVLKRLSRRAAHRAASVELLAESELEKKTDFEDKKKLEKLERAIEKAKIETDRRLPRTKSTAFTK